MSNRLDLQAILEVILGSRNVYYQPPNSIKMVYPAIVYELDEIDQKFADNITYAKERGYLLTLIHKNPDNDLIDTILGLPKCKFVRHFTKDNLHHYIFKIYY